ncbi:hypothetical protein Pint_14166 [Pistacia integerrima]|uniref:Uncharacterized protein n=1 Tax=Pistacia integerrima TaxID=434235 RepID=A0ACC0Y5W2_9ROSI|nr:hypothetical protein Pint_14166 [Pistacia integerrima]
MASPPSSVAAGLLISILASLLMVSSAGNFHQDFDIVWGYNKAKLLNYGQVLTLNLDKESGSGFQSKNEYLFGKIDMQIKLVPGNSAGTVTAYYLSSKGANWDEIDFEFLGNVTEFENMESYGIPFPKHQPMRIYSTLWNADDWATRGGLVKTDWSQAPFTASYTNFNDDNACIWTYGQYSSCDSNNDNVNIPFSNWHAKGAWYWEKLGFAGTGQIKWVQKNYMIYNYCTDYKRFPYGLPKECNIKKDLF